MAVANPQTVGELIELLKLFPEDRRICFSPFNLYRLKDRGDRVNFEMAEVKGVNYKIIEPLPD